MTTDLLENNSSLNVSSQALVESEEHSNEAQNSPSPTNDGNEVYPELQSFVNARERPAVFLLIPNGSLRWYHALQIRFALEGKQFEDLDLVILSSGGDIAAAYSIIRMLRSHTKKRLNACVLLWATSAATLLCLGADEIILDELAHLGPLDTQVPVSEKLDYKSALNPFKSLEELTTLAHNTVFGLVDELLERIPILALSDSFQLATQFVNVVNGTLLTRLDSEKLGEFRLALSEGERYGERVLTQLAHWPEEKAKEAIKKLVYDYPSHNYVIDYYELKDLGFQVQLFEKEKEKTAVKALIKCLCTERTKIGSQTTITIVEPSGNLDGEEALQLT